MQDYYIYYASSNIVGTIIFGIMLAHDCLGIDRQEKQLKYDRTLIAFMLYFISDTVWAAVDSGLIPKTVFNMSATTFINFLFMTGITYSWLLYVMAVEKSELRNHVMARHVIASPFMVSALVFLILFITTPDILIDENMKTTAVVDIFIAGVPLLYIIAVIIFAIKEIRHEEDPLEKKTHIYVAFFPVMVVVGGLAQMLFMPTLPMFCFAGTIFMLIFHIKSTDDQISTDPLTKLNNRAQLIRYVAQESNLRIDGRRTYVIMMDINDFKKINDTYGHAEGDMALVILSQTLVQSMKVYNMPMFLGRFGGDEFVLIAHPVEVSELEKLVEDIRENIRSRCLKENRPYIISMGIGYDELMGEHDTFQKCMQRADSKLYLDKEYCKMNGKSTVLEKND